MILKFADQNTRGEDIQLPITKVQLNRKDRDILGKGGEASGAASIAAQGRIIHPTSRHQPVDGSLRPS
jgi:hypothetical protein